MGLQCRSNNVQELYLGKGEGRGSVPCEVVRLEDQDQPHEPADQIDEIDQIDQINSPY
jgi:hypothetical protein